MFTMAESVFTMPKSPRRQIPLAPRKVFTMRRNQRSRSSGIGVHDPPESVFTIGRNLQRGLKLG